MKMKLYVLVASLVLSVGILNAQESQSASSNLQSLNDYVDYALANSSSYQRSTLNLKQAEYELTGIWRLDETSLKISSDYEGSDDTDDTFDDLLSMESELSVPLVEQLSFNGKIDSDYAASLGMSFSPLTHSTGSELSELNLSLAQAELSDTYLMVQKEAINAALNWMVNQSYLELAEDDQANKQQIYEDDKIRYNQGEVTLDELQDSLVDWSTAIKTLALQQADLRSMESALLLALGGDLATLKLSIVSIDDLRNQLSELKGSINLGRLSAFQDYSVLSSDLAWQKVEVERENTWFFEPELLITSSYSIDDVTERSDLGMEGVSAGISLSFSYDDWQREEQELLDLELLVAKQESALTLKQSELSLQQTLLTIQSAEATTEIAEIELEQAKILSEEASFLYEQGDYSLAETIDAEITARRSDATLFAALSQEIVTWLDLLCYLPD